MLIKTLQEFLRRNKRDKTDENTMFTEKKICIRS